MSMKTFFLLAAGLSLGVMPAFSEKLHDTASPEITDSSKVVDLDEVVVISQPKEYLLLRHQPLSSTVLTSTEIDKLHITDLRDLSNYVPSFTMPDYGSRYTSSMYVRGIGSRINSPAVGVYIDHIPVVNKSMFNFHTYQTDRVDVLRGPQGTLYGQNTEGGLVRLYSRSPLTYQGTDIRLGIGTAFQRNAEVAHYKKVSNQFGFSLAAFYNGQNGFFKNLTTGDRADEMDEAGGKFRMVWMPTNRFSLDFMTDYQYVKQNGFPYGQLDLATGKAQDPTTNRQGNYQRNMLTAGLHLKYVADWADINYSTSWQYLKDDMLMDIDYRPLDYMHMQQQQLQNALTEELTLKGRGQGFWHWTTGGFISYQALKTNAPVFFDEEMNNFLSQTIQDYAYYGMLNSMAARMGLEAAAAMIERAGGCHIRLDMETIPGLFRTPQTNFGMFHESSFDLTDRLTATVGLRYDLSQVSIDYTTVGSMKLDESVMGVNVQAAVKSLLAHQDKASFEQLLPKVGLTWRLDDNQSNIYVTVSKGYRAGGFNIQMFSDILQTELQGAAQTARGDMELLHDDVAYENIRNTIAYKPEESWNYELGTHLNLFGNSVQFDLAAYYMQIRNQQLSVFATNYGFGRMMVNAGKSYSCGIEAALRGKAFDDHLNWGVSYGYTHAVFKEYTDSVTVEGKPVAIDYKDKKVPFVPMHTLALNADYRIDFSGALHALTLGANFTAQGKTWWDEQNTYAQDLYTTLGAYINADFGSVAVSLWGRNLTNTNYNTFAISSSMAGESLHFAQKGRPLQVGLDVNIHF